MKLKLIICEPRRISRVFKRYWACLKFRDPQIAITLLSMSWISAALIFILFHRLLVIFPWSRCVLSLANSQRLCEGDLYASHRRSRWPSNWSDVLWVRPNHGLIWHIFIHNELYYYKLRCHISLILESWIMILSQFCRFTNLLWICRW